MPTSKYFGNVENGEVVPFGGVGRTDDRFVLFLEQSQLYSFAPITGKIQSLTHWSFIEVNHLLQRDGWRYFTNEKLQEFFPTLFKKNIMSSKFIISKGKLYFNETTKQVERVLTIQDGALVWTSRHKQEAKAYSKSAFRLATDTEVQNYLTEASNG